MLISGCRKATRHSARVRQKNFWRRRMAEYMAGNIDDYADGDRKVVVCGDEDVGCFRTGAEFFACHNRCAPRAGPVCQGRIMKRVLEPVAEDHTVRAMEYDESETNIVCPWHGYE